MTINSKANLNRLLLHQNIHLPKHTIYKYTFTLIKQTRMNYQTWVKQLSTRELILIPQNSN